MWGLFLPGGITVSTVTPEHTRQNDEYLGTEFSGLANISSPLATWEEFL